jgi:hypothetical protein
LLATCICMAVQNVTVRNFSVADMGLRTRSTISATEGAAAEGAAAEGAAAGGTAVHGGGSERFESDPSSTELVGVRACRTVPEEHLLRPIVGEQLVLAKRSRENSGRAQQARLESSRNHCTKTNRSPAIGLRCRGCRTVPEEQLLRPIAGERLVLAKRLREDSRRAC